MADPFKGMRYTGSTKAEVPGKNLETYRDAQDREMYYDPENKRMKPTFATRQIIQGEKAGAGRGKQGGPTAEELKDFEEEGITTERKIKRGDYGRPGMAPTEPMPKFAKGGKVSSASSRADGCAQRGKTKGTMIKMG